MTLRDKINQEVGELFAQHADISWFQAEQFTESPIETAFAVAFEWVCRYYFMDFYIQKDGLLLDAENLHNGSNSWVYMEPQAKISEFRVDFLITFSTGHRKHQNMIVECDGHNFHDRTPEQASRDRERDRSLTSSGYRVYRFTGTDLNRRPIECVTELAEFILFRADFP